MPVIPLITIELTPDVAVKLRFMMESGVFDIRSGSAKLNFNDRGALVKIERTLFTVATPEIA